MAIGKFKVFPTLLLWILYNDYLKQNCETFTLIKLYFCINQANDLFKSFSLFKTNKIGKLGLIKCVFLYESSHWPFYVL